MLVQAGRNVRNFKNCKDKCHGSRVMRGLFASSQFKVILTTSSRRSDIRCHASFIIRQRHRTGGKVTVKQFTMKRVLFFAALCCAMLFQTLNAQEITDPQTLYRRGGKIVSDVRPMSGYDDATLQAILGERDFDLYSHNHKLYTKGKTLTTIGWVGLPVGGFLFLIGHIHSYYYYDSPDKYLTSYLAQLFGYVITGVSCALLPTGYTIKGVAAGRISRIAEGYNATHNKGTELSLSMSPTLMNNHGQIAPGVGLTLRF